MIEENFYKAFANKDRIKLLLCLRQEKSVTDLLDSCSFSQSALSQHLKILKDGGVVDTKRDGKFIFYKIKNKKFFTIAKMLLDK